MAFTTNTIVYTGQDTFQLGFALGITSREHVTVRVNHAVDGAGDPQYTEDFTWVNDAEISVNGLVIGDVVTLSRTVPKEQLIASFENGADITRFNLDAQNKHSIMAVQEILDGRFDTDFNAVENAERAEAAADVVTAAEGAISSVLYDTSIDYRSDLLTAVGDGPFTLLDGSTWASDGSTNHLPEEGDNFRSVVSEEGKLWRLAVFSGDTLPTDFYPDLNQKIIAADINKTRVKALVNNGATVLSTLCPMNVLLIMGQSNADGSYTSEAYDEVTGVDLGEDPRVLSWNGRYNIPGSDFNVAKEAQNPFNRNNIGLQAARTATAADGVVRVVLNISKGATPIEHWLPATNVPEPNMYAAMERELSAMWAASGVPPKPLPEWIFIQGGSNESLDSLSLTKRAGIDDPIISWAGAFLELYDRMTADGHIDANTKVLLGEGAHGNIDRFNAGIAMLQNSGLIPNLFRLDNRFEELQSQFDENSTDDNHFSGNGYTRIGKAAGNIIIAPATARVANIIDQPMTIPLRDFSGDIRKAYQYFAQRFEIRDNGFVDVILDESISQSGVVELKGIPESISRRMALCGSLTGSQGAMLASNFVGADAEPDRNVRHATDLATAQGLYQFHINANTRRMFEVEDCCLNLKNLLLYNSAGSTLDIIDLTRARLGLHNVTIIGHASAGTATLIEADQSVVAGIDQGSNPSPLCLAYGRGTNGDPLRGCALSLDDSSAFIQGAVIAESRLSAIIADKKSFIDADNVTFQDVAQNAIDARGRTEGYYRGATFTRVGGDSVSTVDAAELSG